MFKRKYCRSKWFEGLLQAEQLFKEGFIPDYNDFLSGRIGLMKSSAYVSIPASCGDYYDGVLDYIKNFHHYENKFKNN